MSSAYDVFLSFKNLGADGTPTRDAALAKEVFDFLSAMGLRVFFSSVSLEQLGVAGYKRAIDDALDAAQVLVAIGTSLENLDSHWVRYEWDSFFNDILSRRKPKGRLFSYVSGVSVNGLPRTLRENQAIVHQPGSLGLLYNFIVNAGEKVVVSAPQRGSASRGPRSRDPEERKSIPTPKVPVPPALVEPSKSITNKFGMTLVLIPAGEFLMGSPDSEQDAGDAEKPQQRVRITRPFYLGVHQVTQGQYRAVTGANPSRFKGSDDLPVENVSWDDAIAFCNKLSEREGLKPYYQSGAVSPSGGEGYRLPTEAEWEYACRAGSTTRYGFGDDAARLGEFAWYDDNSDRKTHPVGQKRPNAWGLHDMHGNVWEWCWDWYDPNYYGQSPGVDPVGPSQAADRVIRGGSWYDLPRHRRSANRLWGAPEDRSNNLGFRVARVQSGR